MVKMVALVEGGQRKKRKSAIELGQNKVPRTVAGPFDKYCALYIESMYFEQQQDKTNCNEDNDLQEKLINEVSSCVADGPSYVCLCCTQTFFGYNMKGVFQMKDNTKFKLS